MPPLPKRKRSKSRVGTNRAHQHISLVGLVECPHCHEAMKPHHACPSCGYYRDATCSAWTATSNSARQRYMATAFIFPGQGAQAVGMGSDAYHGSPAARAVFDEADSVLGMPLSRLILDGPADALVRSLNAQPAILCVSLALLRAAEERLGAAMPRPAFTAGHSVGEYAALVAAGALSLAEALRLVRTRGELMQNACDATPSGMAALIGLTLEPAQRACEGTGAQVANVNSAEQIVIGGPNDALQRAISNAKQAGARRAIPLEVAGAFHTEVMRPAQEGMARVLAEAALTGSALPVVANTTALPVESAAEIRSELVSQLCGCVYWQQSVELMAAQGVDRFIEFGPGKVLTGLSRRIVTDTTALAVPDLDAVNSLA